MWSDLACGSFEPMVYLTCGQKASCYAIVPPPIPGIALFYPADNVEFWMEVRLSVLRCSVLILLLLCLPGSSVYNSEGSLTVFVVFLCPGCCFSPLFCVSKGWLVFIPWVSVRVALITKPSCQSEKSFHALVLLPHLNSCCIIWSLPVSASSRRKWDS